MSRLRLPWTIVLCAVLPTLAQEPPDNELTARYNALNTQANSLLDQFVPDTFNFENDENMYYRLFTPDGIDTGKVPLVIMLHGAGGKGTDNLGQMTDQIVSSAIWAFPENQASHPSYVLVPQSNNQLAWDESMMPITKALIDSTVTQNNIDPNRIYVTGLSMGGQGSWNMLLNYPYFFAAGVPVCGWWDTTGMNEAEILHRIETVVENEVGVWAFHGALDPVVEVESTRSIILALEQAGGRPIYTEYPDVGHHAWRGAYTDTNMITWLFSNSKPVTVAVADVPDEKSDLWHGLRHRIMDRHSIHFEVEAQGDVPITLSVHSVKGKKLWEQRGSASQDFNWNYAKEGTSGGVVIATLKVGSKRVSKALILQK